MENDMYLKRLRKWLTVSLVLNFVLPLGGIVLSLPVALLGLLLLTNHPNEYVQRSRRFLLGGMALGGLSIIVSIILVNFTHLGEYIVTKLVAFGLIVGFVLSFLAFANLMNIPEIKQTKKVYVEYILYVFLTNFALLAYVVVEGARQPSQAYGGGGTGSAMVFVFMIGYIITLINARRICKIETIAPVQGKISSVADLLRSNQCVGMIVGILVSMVFCLFVK